MSGAAHSVSRPTMLRYRLRTLMILLAFGAADGSAAYKRPAACARFDQQLRLASICGKVHPQRLTSQLLSYGGRCAALFVGRAHLRPFRLREPLALRAAARRVDGN